MRIALKIEYRGTRYVGWQRQANEQKTVQGTIEAALRQATGEEIALHASGRTDAGVHAVGQVAHFDTDGRIPPDKFAEILNNLLPPDISITASREIESSFHARKSALRKTYCYRVVVSDKPHATEWDTACLYRFALDPQSMNKAAQSILGRYDFASFYTQGSTAKTTVRTLKELSVSVRRGEVDADGKIAEGELWITATADGFLYNMVRVLAAQLCLIGQGRKSVESMRAMLRAKDRAAAKEIAPACGLYLMGVDYGREIF